MTASAVHVQDRKKCRLFSRIVPKKTNQQRKSTALSWPTVQHWTVVRTVSVTNMSTTSFREIKSINSIHFFDFLSRCVLKIVEVHQWVSLLFSETVAITVYSYITIAIKKKKKHKSTAQSLTCKNDSPGLNCDNM